MRVILILLLALTGYGPAWARDDYRVRFDAPLERVVVNACFDGTPPARLYHHADAGRFVESFRHDKRKLRLGSGEWTRLRGLENGDCLQWAVRLDSLGKDGDFRFATRSAGALVTDASLWFWRAAGDRNIQVHVSLPTGVEFSAPWAETGRSEDGRSYRVDASPATWSSRIAVGRFHVRRVPVPGTELRLAMTGDLPGEQRGKLESWLAAAAGSVSSVAGSYPVTEPQILIIPIGQRGEPVPWAHVMRGGGLAAEFFVDETRPLAEFLGDWTGVHELSHMLLPFVSSRDRWLSEGLASWYQYLLLARSGALSPEQAWQELHEGFLRGQADTGRKTLAEATADGWRHTMRIYWSGAAMMMLADTRLRARSGGVQSLDTALAALRQCCLANNRRWRALELFEQLDRITASEIFTKLYETHVDSRDFPDLSSTWRRLGIDANGPQLWFSDQGDWVRMRSEIMAGPTL